jgi:hypothetical protein
MKAGAWSMLCPTAPDMVVVISFALVQMDKVVGKKELALLGASSAKGTAAAMAYTTAGGDEEELAPADT